MNIFKQITANNIALEEYPFRKELAMEAYLIENESILKLDSDNFSDPSIIEAELALNEGRSSGNGRIDILAQYDPSTYAIVELKLEEINSSTLSQLENYLKQRNQLLKHLPVDSDNDAQMNLNWVGILVGKTISKELVDKLMKGLELEMDGRKIPIAGITINRYRSQSSTEIYVVTDTYFKFTGANKDYTKYRFNGNEYNKGQLVNAIIKAYVSQNPQITFSQLEKIFPKSIQGSQGCFKIKADAEEVYNRTGWKRHRLNPEELISLSDSIIATSTQWNSNNITEFIKSARKIGYTVL